VRALAYTANAKPRAVGEHPRQYSGTTASRRKACHPHPPALIQPVSSPAAPSGARNTLGRLASRANPLCCALGDHRAELADPQDDIDDDGSVDGDRDAQPEQMIRY
jgi:hypothetical protein